MWAFLTRKTTWILFLMMMSHFEVAACDSGRRCCDDLHHGAVLSLIAFEDLWDGHWGRAGQLLANLFSLFLVTFPEVVAKVNSSQFPSRIY